MGETKKVDAATVIKIIVEVLIVLAVCAAIGFHTYKELDYNGGRSTEHLIDYENNVVNTDTIDVEIVD